MAYRSRAARKYHRKGKSNLLVTIIIIIALLWITFTWVLPYFIGALGKITEIFKGQKNIVTSVSDNPTLAPPVLSIPYEATNSAQIDIHGFATADSKINIYLDDKLATTTSAGEDGSFTAKNISLSLGTNNIYSKTESNSGNASLQSKTIRLIYINVKPALDVSNPTDGQTFSGERKISVSGKTDPNVTVTVNGEQAIIDKDDNFSKQYQLSDGSNTLTVKATDKASNFTQIQRNVTFNP